jgi:hypothetical protein
MAANTKVLCHPDLTTGTFSTLQTLAFRDMADDEKSCLKVLEMPLGTFSCFHEEHLLASSHTYLLIEHPFGCILAFLK